MVGEVVSFMTLTATQCSQWFFQIISAVDGVEFWTTAIGMWVIFKFIFRPIFGYASSDLARNSYNAFKRGKEK